MRNGSVMWEKWFCEVCKKRPGVNNFASLEDRVALRVLNYAPCVCACACNFLLAGLSWFCGGAPKCT